MFSLLSCCSVDNKPEDCRGDPFKFKAQPLDRKVADINNIFLFVSSFYEGSCTAVYSWSKWLLLYLL